MVIFHSYVSLPEGIYNIIRRNNQQIQQICVTRNHQTQEPFSTRQTATRRSAGNPIYPQLPNTELLIPREMPTKKSQEKWPYGKMLTDFPHMSMLNISLVVCWNKDMRWNFTTVMLFFSGFNININIALICVDHVWYWRVSWRNGLLLMTNSHLKTCFWFKRWNIGTVPLFSRTVGCRGVLEYRGRGLKTQRFLTFWWLFGRNHVETEFLFT